MLMPRNFVEFDVGILCKCRSWSPYEWRKEHLNSTALLLFKIREFLQHQCSNNVKRIFSCNPPILSTYKMTEVSSAYIRFCNGRKSSIYKNEEHQRSYDGSPCQSQLHSKSRLWIYQYEYFYANILSIFLKYSLVIHE